MNKISRTTANDLIERIWTISEQLKTIQSELTAIENDIADEVPDDR